MHLNNLNAPVRNVLRQSYPLHAMKEQRVSGSIAPLILYLSTRWRLSVKPHIHATLLLEQVPSSH